MNIHAVQRLMGHADLDVLLRYLDLGEADLAEAHRLYGPVDSLLGPPEEGRSE
jgi:site-specific recombinase XerD